jgi:glycosyltransferase involved in cell wall biosynthesis
MQTPPAVDSRPIVFTEIEQFGGAERSALALSRWLHLRGLPNHVVAYVDRCHLVQHATHPLQVVELKPGPGARSKIAALRSYFRHRPSPPPLLSGYQPALHAPLAGMRGFHVLMHDSPSLFVDQKDRNVKGNLRIAVSNRIIAHGLRSGGNTIVTSEYLRNECRKDFNVEAKIARMGGLDAAVQPLYIRPVEGQLRMFSVCRIEANKRIDWIVRSLSELERGEIPLSSRIDWRFDLAGSGTLLPRLREMARTFGISDRIHFHGFVPDEGLEQLFASAHLFLMPAVQGYGIPAIESLQRGIPVLLHRESGVSDILLDTPWATVFTGGEGQLTEALRSAIDGVLAGRHHEVAQPHLPTETEWAEQVATLCNWI